jgi:hypothetical protein
VLRLDFLGFRFRSIEAALLVVTADLSCLYGWGRMYPGVLLDSMRDRPC